MNQTTTPEKRTGDGMDSDAQKAGMQGQSTPGTGTAGTRQGESAFGTRRGDGRSEAQQQTEGTIARTIEQQTAKLPSDTFLWAAVGAMAASAILEFTGAEDKSRFFGQWVAPLLLFGVYNKMVKQQGSDRLHH